MDRILEGTSPWPRAVKVEKVEPSPEESQDMKALQKELEYFAKLVKQKRTALRYIYPG